MHCYKTCSKKAMDKNKHSYSHKLCIVNLKVAFVFQQSLEYYFNSVASNLSASYHLYLLFTYC